MARVLEARAVLDGARIVVAAIYQHVGRPSSGAFGFC